MKKRVLLLIMCVFAITAASAQATSMAVVGAGVGGWPTGATGEIDANQMTTTDGGITWTIENLVVTGGGIKFRANNDWASDGVTGFNIGRPAAGSAFPSAIGVNDGGSSDINAGVIPGTYKVTLNTVTMAYSFIGGAVIPVVKLIGSAVDGGSIDMIAADADNFSVLVTLLDGTAQFDVDGTIVSDGAYPTGFANEGGSAIGPIPAGEYLVKYNNATSEYSIETPPNQAWALTGIALANFGTGYDWGTDLVLNTTDGVTYTYPEITFEAGAFKFRIAGDWSSAKGGAAFPVGPTVGSEGADIVVSAEAAGIYDVTFNRVTGEYTFTGALSTKGFSNANFKVYPNPTNNVWNFTSANETIESIQIVNVLGKVVLSVSPKNNIVNVDASALNSGIYFAKIATAKATQTIKLIKN